MILTVFWSLWGVLFLVYAYIKQKQKFWLLKQKELLDEKVKNFAYYNHDAAPEQNQRQYHIPLQEDTKKKNQLQQEINELATKVDKYKEDDF